MVGRAAENARAVAALDGLDSGSVLTVEGEPGIGKTRLLGELAAAAEERRFLVLEGRASESEVSVPFAPLLDALDDYLASVNPRVIRPADPDGRAELARIFPSLAELEEGGGTVQEERFRSHRAIRALLEGLAAGRPLLLVIDDAHWADGATLELVSHLVRHRPRAPILLALATRPGPVADRLRSELSAAERIELAPLDDEQAAELIGEQVAAEHLAGVLRQSGGNPFYLEQLARAWAAGSVPADVSAALAHELGGLAADHRLVISSAAVAGDGFDPELAAVAAEVAVDRTLAAIDALLACELIKPTDVPRRFRFRHPIVLQAVYDAAPAGWRLGAHARVAAELQRRGAAAATRAHHVELSASPGDEGAIALLTEAGNAASPQAPEAAAHWFEAALRLLAEDDAGRRLALLIPRARALAACGRYDESLADLDEVTALIPPDAVEVRARVLASGAKVLQILGRHGEARAELERTLDSLEDVRSPAASTLKLELGADSFFVGDQAAFERWVGAALADAQGREDASLIAAATGLHAAALYMRDELAAARDELDRGLALIAALDLEQLSEHLNAHTWTALGAVYMERFDEAGALLDRGIEAALATGQGQMPTLMRTTQALALITQGRLEGAAARLEAAVDAAILTRNPAFLAWSRALQCWATLIAGDLPAAVALGELGIADAAADDPLTATAALYLAEARLAGGDADRARALILDLAGGPKLDRIERGFRSRGYELLCRAELELGAVDAAASWAELAQGAADGLGIDGRDADWLRAQASVALARGDAAAAAEAGAGAREAAARAGLLVDAGRARTLIGRALAAAGETKDAKAELEAAREELAALGAGHYADEAAGQLRRLGVRVPRSQRPTPEGNGELAELSSREREIAELVAAGKRNQEIAEALFLSVRTVEGHLGRVYRKLDVSSRTQLAALVSGVG